MPLLWTNVRWMEGRMEEWISSCVAQRWNDRQDGGDQLERWMQGKGKMWLSKADRVLGSSMELSQAVPNTLSGHTVTIVLSKDSMSGMKNWYFQLNPRFMWMSVVWVATERSIAVCGPCCCREPCLSPWSLKNKQGNILRTIIFCICWRKLRGL